MLVPSKPVWPLAERELKPALRLVTALARADRGILLLNDSANDRLFPVVAEGLTTRECEQFGSHLRTEGPFERAVKQHRLVRLRDVWRAEPALSDAAKVLGFRNMEILPFFGSDDNLLGVFVMIYRARGATRQRAALLESYCGELLATAVAHAHARAHTETTSARRVSDAQAKLQFVARLSHELRTPLQSILGYVDLMRTGVPAAPNTEQTRMLDRIAESARIIVRVIEDLITFSRIQAGSVAYALEPFAARICLRTAQAVLAPLAEARGVQLTVVPCPPGVKVLADESKVKQILVNLTANAIKYTDRGGAVTLSCGEDVAAVWFDVTDNGPGIPADKMQEIFAPYFRLSSGSDASHGSGLGLAISREFAEAMAGSLIVRPNPSGGAIFTLRLPKATASTDAVTAPAEHAALGQH